MADISRTQESSQTQEQAPEAQGAQGQDFGSNQERAAGIPPADAPSGEPALDDALAGEVAGRVAQSQDALDGLQRVRSQLPPALDADVEHVLTVTGQTLAMVEEDVEVLAETDAEEGGALRDLLLEELRDLVDWTCAVNACRWLGEAVLGWKVTALVTQGLLQVVLAQGMGRELQDVLATAEELERLRQQCLAVAKAALVDAARDTADKALSVALDAGVKGLSDLVVPVGGPVTAFGVGLVLQSLAERGKDDLLDRVFGAPDEASMVSGAVSDAQDLVDGVETMVKADTVLTTMKKVTEEDGPLKPVSDLLEAASDQVDTAEQMAELTGLVRQYLAVAGRVAGAKDALARAAEQTAPWVALAKSGQAKALRDRADDIEGASEMVTESLAACMGGT